MMIFMANSFMLIIILFIIFALLLGLRLLFKSLTKEEMCDFNKHKWEAWTCQCALDAPRQKMIICKRCGKAFIHTPGIRLVCEGFGICEDLDIEYLWSHASRPNAFRIKEKDGKISYAMFVDEDVNPELRKDK